MRRGPDSLDRRRGGLHAAVRPRLPADRHRRLTGAVPGKSDGSQVKVDGKTVGSSLIGQSFTIRHPIPKDQRGKFGKKQIKTPDPKYFQPRPSASTYSPDVTFFNNLGPTTAS